MLETLPRGPAKAEEETIDRTMILDPADLWPDAVDCPDWPVISPANMRFATFVRGKAGAEQRLEAIGAQLNRGSGRLRVPTAAEREASVAKTFKRSGVRWEALGLHDLSPIGMLVENDAELIVEAAHVRGYLRKLSAIEAAEAAAKRQRVIEQAQQKVDGYASALANGRLELEGLAEAVARHEQRLADEKAFTRAAEIRQLLRMGHFEAANEARMLGLTPPAEPSL